MYCTKSNFQAFEYLVSCPDPGEKLKSSLYIQSWGNSRQQEYVMHT